jgi:patatin-like phospholipase/acyl hydrolase
LKDAIASTTAAPTYFKEFKLNTVHNKEHSKILKTNYISAVDGGIAANDPALCALTEAMSVYSNADAFLLISMGTGHCVSEVRPKGLLGWAKNISTILMDNSSEMTGHMLKKFGMHSNKPVFFSRLQFDISKTYAEMDNTSQDNLSYLEHQALSTDSIITKTKKLTAILKESEKVDRSILIGNSPNRDSNFVEI